MLYLYSISIMVSCISLILLLIRLFINKGNINLKSNKYNWKLFITLIIISIIPIINIFFIISSIYISIFMKKEKFINLLNE